MDNVVYVDSIAKTDCIEHLFRCLADGDRPVLDVIVIETPGTKEMPILIKAVGASRNLAQETKGITHGEPVMAVKNGLDGLMIVPCIKCIVNYIVPRTATMMARVYVPKDITV
jgi:hypothetical protein